MTFHQLSGLAILASISLPTVSTAGLTSIMIQNPSFQADTFGGVGYANQNGNVITGWSLNEPASIGVTGPAANNGGHFFDNSPIDGDRAAFMQGGSVAVPRVLSQNISGLVAGRRYVAQIWARGRNCCGDSPTFDLTYGSQTLVNDFATGTGTWHAMSTPFIAGSASASLDITSWVAGGGDGSLAVDNVQVFQLDSDYVNILNPSFEAGSSFPFPGYNSSIAGWTTTGGTGYNHAGNNPFADNGAIPEGGTVAFIQNNGSLSQVLTGLTAGQQYLLELDYNARASTGSGRVVTSLGGTTLLDDTFTPNGTYKHLSALWTATGTSATLSLDGIGQGGDSAVVFDNITLRAIPEPTISAVLAAGLAGMMLRRRR